MLKRKNQSIYGDCEALSDEFINKLKQASILKPICKLENQQEQLSTNIDIIKNNIIKISSKHELIDLGYTSIGSGFYKDSKHHLWQLNRDGDSYIIERTAEEETIRKSKETKIASKKIAAVYKVEKEFTIPGFENTIFSPEEEIETFRVSSPSDKYQKSIIQDMLGNEVPVMDTTLSNLVQERFITKISNKISSIITIKSDMPLDNFTKDLDQSGVYYQKRSAETDTETGKLVASFDIEDKDLDTFKSVANDYGIIVEAKKVANELSDFSFNDLVRFSIRGKDYKGRVKGFELDNIIVGFYDEAGNMEEDSFKPTELIKLKSAEIKEAPKVFSDETIIKGISHYMNIGFTKNEAIKEFILSNNLDKEYKNKIENVLDKYNF